MLNNFTKNTRSELKNIEKKYGIKKWININHDICLNI
jgi:RNA recognition motif-containing protein